MRFIVERKGPFVAALIGIHIVAFEVALVLAFVMGKALSWRVCILLGLAVGVGLGWLAARLVRARRAFINRLNMAEVKYYLDGLIQRDVQ